MTRPRTSAAIHDESDLDFMSGSEEIAMPRACGDLSP